MSKVTQLEGSGAEIKIQVCLVPKPTQPPEAWGKVFGVKIAGQLYSC